MLFVPREKNPKRDEGVTGRTRRLPESHIHSLACIFSLASLFDWKQPTSLTWPFPACGRRTKKVTFFRLLSLSLFFQHFLCLSCFSSDLSSCLSFICRFLGFISQVYLTRAPAVLDVTLSVRSTSITSTEDSGSKKKRGVFTANVVLNYFTFNKKCTKIKWTRTSITFNFIKKKPEFLSLGSDGYS